VAASVFGSGKTNRFEPLFFVLRGFGEEDLLWATEPPAVSCGESGLVLEVEGYESAKPSVFSERCWRGWVG
jgi:hypothetical protein